MKCFISKIWNHVSLEFKTILFVFLPLVFDGHSESGLVCDVLASPNPPTPPSSPPSLPPPPSPLPPPVDRHSPMRCHPHLLLPLLLPSVSIACQPKAFSCSHLASRSHLASKVHLASRSLSCACAHHSPPPTIHNLGQVFQSNFQSSSGLATLSNVELTNCSDHTRNLKLHLGKPFTSLNRITFSSFFSLSLLLSGKLLLPVSVDIQEVSSLSLQGAVSCLPGSDLFLSVRDVRRLSLNKLHLPSCNLHLNLTRVKNLEVGVIRVRDGGLHVEGQPLHCLQGSKTVNCENLLRAQIRKGDGWPMVHLTLLLIVCLTILTIVVICTYGKRPGDQEPAFRRGWL